MGEARKALGRMGVYYLLLAGNILPCASVIPDSFPTRNLSSIYLLAVSVGLMLYYAHRVTPSGGLSGMMKALSWMALLMILLRAVKYSVFAEVGVLARHAWYLYYVPMLLLPLFLFWIALLAAPRGLGRASWVRYPALGLTAACILLVLTNDLHQLVFRFRPGFLDWDRDYVRNWSFYAVTAWQYVLYLAAILILVLKCRLGSARKNAWLLLIPMALGCGMFLLLLTDNMPRLNGSRLMEFPEALIFTAAAVVEGCMQLGLIPTNTDYGRLFRQFSISAQITDPKGTPVYVSRSALPLTPDQFALESGARIGAHQVLRRMALPGGCGFWQEDLTELDRLNEALAEAKEALAQEAELIRLRNRWREQQAQLEQRTQVYDAIARNTQRQSQLISRLAEAGRRSRDPAEKETCRCRIILLGAYIKRYANLTLLSQEGSPALVPEAAQGSQPRQAGSISLGELGLSVSEVLRYLNLCGIPGELLVRGEGSLPAEAALTVFEAFETLLETNFDRLRGILVNLTGGDSPRCKLTLENLTAPLPAALSDRLSALGVGLEVQEEDQVTYISLTLPKGGGAV